MAVLTPIMLTGNQSCRLVAGDIPAGLSQFSVQMSIHFETHLAFPWVCLHLILMLACLPPPITIKVIKIIHDMWHWKQKTINTTKCFTNVGPVQECCLSKRHNSYFQMTRPWRSHCCVDSTLIISWCGERGPLWHQQWAVLSVPGGVLLFFKKKRLII